MKLSELKFKVITGTPERNRAIQEALFAKGGEWTAGVGRKIRDLGARSLAHNAEVFGKKFPNLSYGGSLSHFAEKLFAPEVTFQQALDLISQVEMPEPEFPFKPKDWCMVTDPGAPYGWKLAIYSNIADGAFQCIGNYYKRIAPLDEKMLGAIGKPAEWWEIKDGKPKLMRG